MLKTAPGTGCSMHYKNIDVEHRTYTPQDSVKSQPCSLKTSLRLGERDKRDVALPLILLYDETREQGMMLCPTRPARHPGVPDTQS